VFVTVPEGFVDAFGAKHGFGWWDRDDRLVRLMCAFDTTPADVDALLSDIAALP